MMGGFSLWGGDLVKCCFCELVAHQQGRNEVSWRPGQEESLAPPSSN